MAPKGPFRLVTVNTAPERAKQLIGRMVEALKDQYTIDYVANCETITEVEEKVKAAKPDVLVSFIFPSFVDFFFFFFFFGASEPRC